MKRFRRFLSLALALMMIIPSAGVCASADDAVLTYKLSTDGTYYTVSGCTGSPVNISVPKEYNGIPVTMIGVRAFIEKTTLTSITLPEGITDIGTDAFYKCTALESINAPLTLVNIGTSAFEGCTALDIAGFLDSSAVETIEDNAFKNCTGSKVLNMPSTLLSFGKSAFYGCTAIESVTLPSELTVVGDLAFCKCTKLSTVTFGKDSQLDSIGASAFKWCPITSIIIPEGTTSIGASAFAETNLTSITIPASMEHIYDTSLSNGSGTVGNSTFAIHYTGTDEEWDTLKASTLYFTADEWAALKQNAAGYSDEDWAKKKPGCADFTANEWEALWKNLNTDISYYSDAEWEALRLKTSTLSKLYRLEFISDGKAFDIKYVRSGYTITAPAGTPVKDYTTFLGWAKQGSSEIIDDFKTMPSSDSYCEAVFEPVTYYAEFTDENGNVLYSIPYIYTDKVLSDVPAVPEKEGYDGHWDSYILTPGGITVKAVYEVNTYYITFSYDGKTEKKAFEYGEAVTAPETESREGYTFTWTPELPSVMPAKDLNVSGKYTANTYEAVLMADGVKVATVEYTYGQKSISLPAVPAKTGYTGSWGSYSLKAGGTTINAVYTVNSYNIKFVTGEGTYTKTYAYGSAVEAPVMEAKQGFEFRWQSEVPAVMPAKDMTVYGSYICTGSLSIAGNTGSKTINYGEDLQLTAKAENLPDGARLKWTCGSKTEYGETFNTGTLTSGTVVTLTLTDENGKTLQGENGDMTVTENVNVSGGIFKMIISFFKNLFGSDRTVYQK